MNASKAKGTRWESEIIRCLRANGWPHVERRALNGTRDRGDVTGIPGLVIEAKDHNRLELAEWVRQAEREAANDGGSIGVAWIHRKGRSTADKGYVVMQGDTFMRLLTEAGYQ